MDWLSRLLELIPVHGQVDIRCAYGAPWQVDFDRMEPGEIPYHVILRGTALIGAPDGGCEERLTAGDIVLLPNGAPHVLRDETRRHPVVARARMAANLVVSENDGTGERLDMLCGRFVLTPPYDRLLLDYLPPRLVVHAPTSGAGQAPGVSQLAGLVALLQAESASENLGGRAMLNALSTALFALALRVASEGGEAPSGLLALAGNPRLAPALTAMFQDPARPWTLPELADLCHMSRATLARHFKERVGRSAADLLTDIRMTLAAKALRDGPASTGAVADMVGYQSEAAFQRAFKQTMGVTPAAWRRAGRP
jgi:AraC family transcriptional activator of mtrCDE